jgi:hypothetical protein
MLKNSQSPIANSQVPAGSGRKCQWMEQARDWEDCGAPATYVAPGIGMAYCEYHAAGAIVAPLVRIAPNTGVGEPPQKP